MSGSDPRATFRFLFDEHVHYPAYRRLDADGIDVAHVGQIRNECGGLEDDLTILEFAARENRIVVTRNYQDFEPLAKSFTLQGRAFPGILFIPKSLPGNNLMAHVNAVTSWIEGAAQGHHQVADTFGWLVTP